MEEMSAIPRSRRLAQAMALLAMIIPGTLATGAARAAPDMSQCQALADVAARLRCYESLLLPKSDLPTATQPVVPSAQMIGRWRILRTPHPRGEKDAISITRGGELSGSDSAFAGLMIRCMDKELEVLVVLLHPISFRAEPIVSINGTKFPGKVVPPGTVILLPREVTVSAREKWAALSRLSLTIDEGKAVIKGLISLQDFEPALKALTETCSTR